MNYMPVSSYHVFFAIVLALILSGCASVRSFLPGSVSDQQTQLLQQQLRAVDEANDRTQARNEMMAEMMAVSDDACEQYIHTMLKGEQQQLVLTERPADRLDARLKAAISMRVFDQADAEHALLAEHAARAPLDAIVGMLAVTMRRDRSLSRIRLQGRLEADISAYSLKQALMDMAAYHRSCSAAYAITSLSNRVSRPMTAEKRQSLMDELIMMRQRLISEGVNTRAVQQKINALILTD